MLHSACYITPIPYRGTGMAKGSSGRLVIEIDPELKKELYEALEKEELTLKDWFLKNAGQFLKDKAQPSLFPLEEKLTRKVS